MAERRPRVVIVPPGGAGLKKALHKLVTPKTILTSLEDGMLHSAKRMLEDKPLDEIIPFGSCVGRVAAMCGDTGFPRLTGPQSHHIIQRAASELNFENSLSGAAFSIGLAKKLVETVTQLRHHQISHDDLLRISELIDDPVTSERCRCLSELINKYEDKCHSNGKEFASERAEYCIALESPQKLVFEHMVIILVGDQSPVYNSWIKWVASQGVKVDCIIAAWPESGGVFSYEIEWAKSLGDVEDWTEQLAENEAWTRGLFMRVGDKPLPNKNVKVNHFIMGDFLSESEWIIREIQKLLQAGVEPSTIAVFARGSSEVTNIFLGAAERLGLLVAGTRSSPLNSNGFVANTLEFLKSLASDDIRTLRFSLLNSYFNIPGDEYNHLVKVLITLQANSQDPWSDFKSHISDDMSLKWICELIEWREKSIGSPKPLGIWAEHLHTIWSNTPILDNSIRGPIEAVKRDQQAWTVMQRTIRDAALAFQSEHELTFKEFITLAETLWQGEQIIWEADSGSTVFCSSASQLIGFDHIFCLNMLEGVLPRRQRQDPTLDDLDRKEINRALGTVSPLPLSIMHAERERALFTTLCSAAQKSVTFSHSEVGEERDNIATFYLDEVKDFTGDIEPKVIPRSQIVPAPEECNTWPDRELSTVLFGPRVEYEIPFVATTKAQNVIRPNLNDSIDIRELAQAASCPFKSVFNHKVKFKAPQQSLSISILRSIPLKAHLIKQPSASTAKDVMLELAKTELQEHIHRMDDWEQVLYNDAIERIVQGWIDKEFQSRISLELTENYEIREGFVGRSQLKEPAPIKLRCKFDAVYERNGYRIGFYYDSYIPKDQKELNQDSEGSLLAKLMLFSLKQGNISQVAVLVDAFESDRLILTKENLVDWLPQQKSSIRHIYFESKNFESRQLDAFGFGLKRQVEESVAVLMKATSNPKPGDNCERCHLGELCRNHQQFGESLKMFGDDF